MESNNVYLDSTEINRNNVWRTVAGKLYAKMWGASATNLSNKVLLFGKPYND